ncbi:hypothetical protein [Streptomyces sp. H51]|uniref:hypothetical protein n=1 Tax=Streptomyces sp. H51 TaxID=3111770 RepID=UPI002D7916ED|nr:hypothetical protein [Streptomyces sp. H51]
MDAGWAAVIGAVVGAAGGFGGPLVVQDRQKQDAERQTISQARAATLDYGLYMEEVVDDAKRGDFPALAEFDAKVRPLRSAAEQALGTLLQGKTASFYATVSERLRTFHDDVRHMVANASPAEAAAIHAGMDIYQFFSRRRGGIQALPPMPYSESGPYYRPGPFRDGAPTPQPPPPPRPPRPITSGGAREEPEGGHEPEEPHPKAGARDEPEAEESQRLEPEAERANKKPFSAYPGGVKGWLDESAAQNLPPKLADEWNSVEARQSGSSAP